MAVKASDFGSGGFGGLPGAGLFKFADYKSGRRYNNNLPRSGVSGNSNAISCSLNSNTLYVTAFPVFAAKTFDRIGFVDPSGSASGNMKVSIHDANTDALILDCGVLNFPASVGLKEIAISQALPAGFVKVAVKTDAAITIAGLSNERMAQSTGTAYREQYPWAPFFEIYTGSSGYFGEPLCSLASQTYSNAMPSVLPALTAPLAVHPLAFMRST